MIFPNGDGEAELIYLFTCLIYSYQIDPIDLAVFEPPLNKNIDRHYSRSIILLGLILQLNPRVADM